MEEIKSNLTYTPEPDNRDELKRNLASEINKKERDIQEEGLKTDKNWIEASKILYQIENDTPYEGDDESAAKMGLDLMSHLNYNLTLGTIPFASKMATQDLTDVQKIATRYMFETYDAKDITMDGILRFGKEIGKDPSTYIGVGTLGWGMAAKTGAKAMAKKGLWEATKLNVKEFAKSSYGAAAFEGAVYSAADDAAFQNIRMGTGEQDNYSPSQTAVAGTIGAVVAPTAVKGLSMAGQQITKGGGFLRDELAKYAKGSK